MQFVCFVRNKNAFHHTVQFMSAVNIMGARLLRSFIKWNLLIYSRKVEFIETKKKQQKQKTSEEEAVHKFVLISFILIRKSFGKT